MGNDRELIAKIASEISEDINGETIHVPDMTETRPRPRLRRPIVEDFASPYQDAPSEPVQTNFVPYFVPPEHKTPTKSVHPALKVVPKSAPKPKNMPKAPPPPVLAETAAVRQNDVGVRLLDI